MTPKHGTGLRYMEMTHESYFRISWRCLHKNNRLSDLGGASPPYSIWLLPSKEDTISRIYGGIDHKTLESHVRPNEIHTFSDLKTIIYTFNF